MTKSTGVDNTTLVCAISADTEKSAVIFAQDMKIRRSQVSYNAAFSQHAALGIMSPLSVSVSSVRSFRACS